MSEPSSQDLHPRSGARFVFDRLELGPPARYSLTIYLASGASLLTTLTWVGGDAHIDPSSIPTPSDAAEQEWALSEALKLARILHRTPKPRAVLWRAPRC